MFPILRETFVYQACKDFGNWRKGYEFNMQNSLHETVWNVSIISIITFNMSQIQCIKHTAKKCSKPMLFFIWVYYKCMKHMLGIYFIFCICKISNLYQQKPQRQPRSCPQSKAILQSNFLTPHYHFKEQISWLKWRKWFSQLMAIFFMYLLHRIQNTHSTRISLKFLLFKICTVLKVHITNKINSAGLFYSVL